MKCFKFNDDGALFAAPDVHEARAEFEYEHDGDPGASVTEVSREVMEVTAMRGGEAGEPATLAGMFDQLTAGSSAAVLIATTEE